MYLLPPTRALRAYALGGRRIGAANPQTPNRRSAAELIIAYDRLRARAGSACVGCGKAYMEAPALRLWVKDPNKPHRSESNLEMLCWPCCKGRLMTIALEMQD